MLKFNKKTYISAFFALSFSFSFLGMFLINISQVKALSPEINQVKVPGEATVYYLNHATHQRKAYINEAVFIDYGNTWEAVRTISPEELANWPEAQLIKTADSEDLYYIQEGKKVKIKSYQDIIDYKLSSVLPLTVSAFELSQYEEQGSYQETGLLKALGLEISQSLINNQQSGNVLVPGTLDNQVMLLHFQARNEAVSVQSLRFNSGGLYDSKLVDDIYLVNAATGERLKGHSTVHDREVSLYLNQGVLLIPAGATVDLRVMLDLKSISSVGGQDLRLQLLSADSIGASAAATGNFPLVSSTFYMVEANSILGRVEATENSLNGNGSARNLGVFTLAETSGQEDVYIKEMVFSNEGTAGRNDLDTFKLKKDGKIIASAKTMDRNRLVFDISYLRIPANTRVQLTLSANLTNDYQSQSAVDLSLERLTAVGRTYEFSLSPLITNLQESFLLP
jgi:hypothetical protein